MKPTRLVAAPQLNSDVRDAITQAAVPDLAPDDASQSGVRPAVRPESAERPSEQPSASRASDVTVVFRGVLPMERLVQLIRRRADETAFASPLRVEVEQLHAAQRWRVRLQTAQGEFAAMEPGPFLAVTRAFALMQ
jgi:hypothetical protein